MASPTETPLIRVGQVVGAFGLKGHVKVRPLTDFLERFEKGTRLKLGADWVEIEESRIHKGRPILKLKGIDDISVAESIQWQYLETEEEPDLLEDEYLVDELVGLSVYLESGEELGEVDEVLNYPAHDLLQVGETLIPLVKEFVVNIDLEQEKITVRLIPGMLPGELEE